MRIYPKVKVAAVQASPIYLNVNASVEKASNLIREALMPLNVQDQN